MPLTTSPAASRVSRLHKAAFVALLTQFIVPAFSPWVGSVSADPPASTAADKSKADDKNKTDKSKTDSEADASVLTLSRIYGSGEFAARSYGGRWHNQGHDLLRIESTGGNAAGKGIVATDMATEERRVLISAEDLTPAGSSQPLNVEQYTFSQDASRLLIYTNSKRVWRQNTRGDYWVLDRSARTLRQLGGQRASSSLMFAKFSPDGNQVAYVHERNLYVENLLSGEIRQLTRSSDQNHIYGTADWVNEEEFGIRDGFRWSPDGSEIALWHFDTTGVEQMTLINNTDQMYPTLTRFAYPKTGQTNSAVQAIVVDVASARATQVPLPGDPRDHYIVRMDWVDQSPSTAVTPGEGRLMIQQMNRLQNTNRLWVWDQKSRQLDQRLVETDEAWVDVHDELFWIQPGQRFTWISQSDGWRRVYVVDMATSDRKPITPPGCDAIELLKVDPQANVAYVIASPAAATDRYLYRAKLDDSSWERLTPTEQIGSHDYKISDDNQYAIHTFSNLNTPPQIDLIRLADHATVRTLETNDKLAQRVKQLNIAPATLMQVEIADDVKLDAWQIRPVQQASASIKHPLLMYVYGEPAGTTVVNRWGGASYLWHQMLAQQGFVVMSVDNRGTPAPRGRQWRKSIYRNVGIHAPADQAAAVREILRRDDSLDARRVGVWGWSGGGSMSLLAIFKYPELYHTAISIAPVPNQRYYDTIYQERYMGLPSDNTQGYLDGSATTHASELKGNLLLVHGTGDDNCHYATSEMLINELIRHDRPFNMLAYPNRSHSISEGKNTTLHLRTMMTRYLMQHMQRRSSKKPRQPAKTHRE